MDVCCLKSQECGDCTLPSTTNRILTGRLVVLLRCNHSVCLSKSCAYRNPWGVKEGVTLIGARVMDHCEPPIVGAEK